MYASRPQAVRDAVARVSLDGKINDPLITVHGTADALLPIGLDSDVYDQLIKDAHRDRYHRYYRVEGATHVDGALTSTLPVFAGVRADYLAGNLRPLLPCYRQAFDQLERWVRDGVAPPPSTTIARRPGGDEVNAC